MADELIPSTPNSAFSNLPVRQQGILQGMLNTARKYDATVEDLKVTICPFFQKGNHPNCRGCEQLEHVVRDCADDFANLIERKPMMQWQPSFNDIIVADKKVQVSEVPGLGMRCDDCYIAEKCAMYLVGSECRIEWAVDEEDIASPKAVIQSLMMIQMKRIKRASAFEEMEGGVPDQNLSNEMDRLAALTQQLNDVDAVKFKRTEEVSVPRGNTSILSQIFGPKQDALPETTTSTTVEVEGEVHVLDTGIPQPQQSVKIKKKSNAK